MRPYGSDPQIDTQKQGTSAASGEVRVLAVAAVFGRVDVPCSGVSTFLWANTITFPPRNGTVGEGCHLPCKVLRNAITMPAAPRGATMVTHGWCGKTRWRRIPAIVATNAMMARIPTMNAVLWILVIVCDPSIRLLRLLSYGNIILKRASLRR